MRFVMLMLCFYTTVGVSAMEEKDFNSSIDLAVEFITSREGFRSHWYDDSTGKTIQSKDATCDGVATIGHGLTGIYWDDDTITVDQSKAIVRRIIERDAKMLIAGLKYVPTVNSLAALCSLAYRRGVHAILRSKTFKAVNDCKWEDVDREWREFNTSGGKILEGLNTRCADELDLFFT